MQTTESQQLPITTPLACRLQRARAKYLPVMFFAMSCIGCGLLWQFQNRAIVQIGEVETVEITLTSPQTGVIQWATRDGEKMPQFFAVKKDQVIAALSDEPVRRQLQTVKREVLSILDVASAKLVALQRLADGPLALAATDASGPSVETQSTEAELSESINAQTEAWKVLSKFTEVTFDRISHCERKLELREIDATIRTLIPETNESSASATAADSAPLLAAQNKRLKIVHELQQLETKIDRLLPTISDEIIEVDQEQLSSSDRMLFRQNVEQSRLIDDQLASINQLRQSLDILSPISGQIDKTLVRSQQTIEQGFPVAIITPSKATYIVVYAREQSIIRPFVGMPVTISSSVNRRQTFSSVVESVGPKIESIPARQRPNARVEEWGRPMRIPVPKELEAPPGSLVNVAF